MTSEIAKNYSSRHTKTACIINGAIAPFYQQDLVDIMKNGPYTIAIDGSSDTGTEKMNPLTVRIFDVNNDTTVSTQFLDMCMSSSATAAGIFSKIKGAWYFVWKLCWNWPSVNMGCTNSIKTRMLQKNSAVYVMGCPCHIVHNTASKAGIAFEKVCVIIIMNLILPNSLFPLRYQNLM